MKCFNTLFSESPVFRNWRAEKIVSYIGDHLHEPMPIKMISQKFGISIFSIENYFSTRYRANFHSFVETRKMAKAYQLMTKEECW